MIPFASGPVRVWLTAAALGLLMTGCAWRPSIAEYQALATRDDLTGLQVRFLGTTSFIISDEETTLVIDGFVTRPKAADLVLSRPIESAPDALDRYIAPYIRGTLEAVLVAHTHYDHALDSAAIAERWQAPLFGSQSLAALLPEGQTALPLPGGRPLRFGQFEVTAYRTGHSRGDLAPGILDAPLDRPAAALEYLGGEENYAFRITHGECRILLVTSAGVLGEGFPPAPNDVVFLSIGRLARATGAERRDYLTRAVSAAGAALVVPVHWDDPSSPLSQPLVATPYLLDRVDRSLAAVVLQAGPSIDVRLPPSVGAIDFSDARAGNCRA